MSYSVIDETIGCGEEVVNVTCDWRPIGGVLQDAVIEILRHDAAATDGRLEVHGANAESVRFYLSKHTWRRTDNGRKIIGHVDALTRALTQMIEMAKA